MASTLLKTYEFPPLQLRQNVKRWHSLNPHAYGKFYKLFERLQNLDNTFIKKLYAFFADCIPQELIDAFQYLIAVISEENAEGKPIPYLVEKYDAWVEQCMDGTHTITVDMNTQEVGCLENESLKGIAVDNTFIINLSILELLTTPVSKKHMAYLSSLWDEMTEDIEEEGISREECKKEIKELFKTLMYASLIYITLCAPKFIKNCQSKSTRHSNWVNSLMYFLIFENGLPKMVQVVIDNINRNEALGPEFHFAKEQIIKQTVNVSVTKGYETKDFWKEKAKSQKEIDDEDSINIALSHIKGKVGRKPNNKILEEILKGDNIPALLKMIEDFVKEELITPEEVKTVDLGCLFYILYETKHIRQGGYETFHNAIQAYTGNIFKGHTEPQEWYGVLCAEHKYLDISYAKDFANYLTRKWENARRLWNKWKPRFESI